MNTSIAIIIQVIGILYIVSRNNWWIIIVYIMIMIPTVLMTFKNGKTVYQEEKKIGYVTRHMNYLSNLLIDR